MKIPPIQSLGPNPKFPKNASGETYGSGGGLSPFERKPDLIKARGVNGKTGYIRQTEADGDMPKSLEEALAQQAKREIRVINVYESDGKTIIDKFEIKPASNEMIEERRKRIEEHEKRIRQNKL